MSKWYPIETAPRDGVEVMLYGEQIVREARRNGLSEASRSDSITQAHWNKHKEKWWTHIGSEKTIVHIYKPTHWMPLPKPPEEV